MQGKKEQKWSYVWIGSDQKYLVFKVTGAYCPHGQAIHPGNCVYFSINKEENEWSVRCHKCDARSDYDTMPEECWDAGYFPSQLRPKPDSTLTVRIVNDFLSLPI